MKNRWRAELALLVVALGCDKPKATATTAPPPPPSMATTTSSTPARFPPAAKALAVGAWSCHAADEKVIRRLVISDASNYVYDARPGMYRYEPGAPQVIWLYGPLANGHRGDVEHDPVANTDVLTVYEGSAATDALRCRFSGR